MSQTETDILRLFRRYQAKSCEMLFFSAGVANSQTPQFKRAMQSLIERGLVTKETRHDAYSLTRAGFQASLSA
jgi:hypothetical protein